MVEYQSVIEEIQKIIAAGQNYAYQEASKAMVMTYWQIGKRITEEEQEGKKRAAYGKQLINVLADQLTRGYGQGFSVRNLRNFRKFYELFPDREIWQACLPNLTWSHICCLLRVPDEAARLWYMKEAVMTG